MALSQKALQRKREDKKKKRSAKVTSLSKEIAYSDWPLYECWVPIELWEAGLGQVIVTRKNHQGVIAVGMYLIDTFCLGIKDCFVRLTDSSEYNSLLERVRLSGGEIARVEPSYANTLIIKSAKWANQFGFRPHSDFAKAKNLLKDIPLDESQSFSFGQGGEPVYIQGPHDSPADIKRVLKALGANQVDEHCHAAGCGCE